jgi:peptidoglycan/LPS O-acetylase OafA/YrhL
MRGAFFQTRFQPPPTSGALKPYVEPRDVDALGREDAAYLAAFLGLVSVMALAASFIWAHHWGPLAYTIVGIWAITGAGALVLAMISRRGASPARGLAIFALACVTVSVVTIVFTGTAFAAGYDPTGVCGGG